MKKVLFLIILIASIILGGYLYFREGSLAVDKRSSENIIFVVSKGEALNNIAKNLEKKGLIRNKVVFYAIVKQLGIERSIQAGDFRLSPSMNAYTIAKSLTHGTLDVWITLIEGTRKEEMAQVISQNLMIPESEFIKNANEGYLFPDTYLIPRDATADTVINILKSNFNIKFDSEIKNRQKVNGLTREEILILASMVEKEAKLDIDRPIVAGILMKRLQNKWPLQIDATIQYALGYQPKQKTWWKKDLTREDIDIDSPYNTYKNQELPPGPICNPGIASIKSVINPDIDTPYWYYISDKSSKMHYAKTLEEHNANIAKYLQ